MFDINGVNKLSEECIENREDIIRYHANNPKACLYFSHSAGKDSMAGYLAVKTLFPHNRIVVIHANLGVVEHDGVIENIEGTIDHELVVVRNEKWDFLDLVMDRKMFPSSATRNCTSTLKSSVIHKFIRAHMKDNGYTIGINATGLRAQESRQRALKSPLILNKELSLKSGKRTVFDLMPIFHYSTDEVFDAIEKAGIKPHPVYGNRGDQYQRLSCKFCIMGSKNDLSHGAKMYVEHYHQMIALERVVGHTMFGKTKTIRTDEPMRKGERIEGLQVTSSRKLKKQVDGKNVYSNTVFVPVSLSERAGEPVNELLVQSHMIRLRKRMEFLERRKREEQAQAATKREAKNTKTCEDTKTVDMFVAV